MKRKRPRRKSQKPPPVRSRGGGSDLLQYKVIELSAVDESTLEATLNEWARRGWALDGIQFAMRESSKRPAMAFVLFTRQGVSEAPPDEEEARGRLRRLAEGSGPAGPPKSAYQRLEELAEGGDE